MSENIILELSPAAKKIITAGEVILSVSSVVKELVENSIDACATQITIKIHNINEDKIEVIDNGHGISKVDLPLAIKPHFTSKFKSIDTILSLGFRGEALHSIYQVSHLTIKSSNLMLNDKGLIVPKATNKGTHIIVKDLFYNYPVRQKWIKKRGMKSRLLTTIEPYVLAYPHIDFRFYYNKKVFTFNSQNLAGSIFNITENIVSIDFHKTEKDIIIRGTLFQGLQGKYFIYINNRPIQDRGILLMVRSIYRVITGYPEVSFILFIECEPMMYDVNIHPTKEEVRFFDNEVLRRILENSIREKLSYWRTEYMNNMLKPEDTSLTCNDISYNLEPKNILFLEERYALFIYDDSFILLDMHAAHERILSEKYKKNYKTIMNNLLIPIKISLSEKILNNITNNKQYLNKFIQYTLINKKIIIYAMDVNLCSVEVSSAIKNFFHISQIEEILHKKLHDLGCKRAIKVNQYLTPQEAKKLLDSIMKTNNGTMCNHGRNTYHVFNRSRLAKLFMR